MKITSSQMLVAWSPIRSRWRETRIHPLAPGRGDAPLRPLDDVGRLVSDPFHVRVDLHCGGDEAEIDGRRLAQRDELDARLVDLDVELVDPGLHPQDLRGEGPRE